MHFIKYLDSARLAPDTARTVSSAKGNAADQPLSTRLATKESDAVSMLAIAEKLLASLARYSKGLQRVAYSQVVLNLFDLSAPSHTVSAI